MKILVKEQVLPPLIFSDDEICIECVKEKLTKTKKKGATRNSDLLEIIHTDFCGSFPHQTIDGNRYFITFIDDHSRFGYLFEMFKKFQTEVERQLEKNIKIVRSDKEVPNARNSATEWCDWEKKSETLKDMFIEHEENATRNEDFIFEEKRDVVVIKNDEQDVTPLIPLCETVLEPPQFEEPVDN
ncbi:unnamed protein product [Prunus armeniaca]